MKTSLKTLLKIFKPFQLTSMVMSYLLGAGLVQYVRRMESWRVFIEGLVFLLIFSLLIECLSLLEQLRNPVAWPKGVQYKEVKTIRTVVAMIAATFTTMAITMLVNWAHLRIIGQGLAFLLLILIGTGGAYYFSRNKKAIKPLEILIEAFLFVVIPSALGYFLQSSDTHFLLMMVAIALIPGYLSNRLLGMLKTYASDYRVGEQNLVISIGWEKAMVLQNLLIILTYFLFALMAVLGFPWFLLWPVFLTFPIALIQIWLMERVKRGMKPLWTVMQIATACVLFIPIYLLSFTFWIR